MLEEMRMLIGLTWDRPYPKMLLATTVVEQCIEFELDLQ
jgi:hypothetical protein